MADDFKVYKTRVNVSVGFSIEQVAPDGSHAWEKSGVSIETESGPGYPTAEQMVYIAGVQMQDAINACERQIEDIANRTIEKAGVVGGRHDCQG